MDIVKGMEMICKDCLIWRNKKEGLGEQVVHMTDYLCENGVSLDALAWLSVSNTKQEFVKTVGLMDSECENPCIFFNKEILTPLR